MAVSPSREELIEEARRRGIADPEKLAPRELERLAHPKRPSKSFWGRVLGKVRGALGTEGSRSSPPPDLESGGHPEESGTDPNQEPIPTRTMAGLLAAQGHEERALAIYERLLSEPKRSGEGGNAADLEAEAASVRRRVEARSASPHRSAVVAVVSQRSGVLVAWHVPGEALRRARQQLGPGAELTARVVVVRPDTALGAQVETWERSGRTAGEWVVGTLPAGSRVTSSIGYRRGERFVSAAHSSIVEA